MRTLFISDLHLDENHLEMAELFLHFLKKVSFEADALYILGDFFEAWIGDDDLSPFNKKIIDALSYATKRLPIYFMHGNRDFLIGKKFASMTGCRLLPEEFVVDLYGTRALLMHGDSLCTLDKKYLAFRKKSRTWWYKLLVSFKSLKSRRAIANKMRAVSREHVQATASYIMDVTPTEVLRVMEKHKVQHLIHGHTHRPAVHALQVKNKPATRTVLGAWHEQGSVLICSPNDWKLDTLSLNE